MATVIVVEDLAAPSVVGRGGEALRVVQFLEGLRRLGHKAVFVEFLDEPPEEAAVAWFRSVMHDWWDPGAGALLSSPDWQSHAGLTREDVVALASTADAVVTIAAHYRDEHWPLIGHVRPRILFEQDPGYTHLWAETSGPAEIFGEHDLYFTVGGNIGSERCRLPTFGIDWHPLWNPVVLDFWNHRTPPDGARFTTVAGWRDYGWLEFGDILLGPKSEEFYRFLDLPRLANEPLEVVTGLDADDPDRVQLENHGWTVTSPVAVAAPEDYREFILSSAGEFGPAKGGYVGTRCGWFSDRSACYLAAGRPVVAQATGFEDLLPTGEGLFAVCSLDEAAEALRLIHSDYERQSRGARRIARDHFDSLRLLQQMLAHAGITA